MKYKDLRDFIKQLEKQGELKRITVEVDPYLEMTEICDRVLRAGGPATEAIPTAPTGHDSVVTTRADPGGSAGPGSVGITRADPGGSAGPH